MPRAAAGGRPLAVPGPVALLCYSLAVLAAVLLRLALRVYRLFPTVLALCLGLQVLAVVAVPALVLGARCCGGCGREERPFRREPLELAWLPRPGAALGCAAWALAVWALQASFAELQVWRAAAALECAAMAPLLLRAALGSLAGVSERKLVLDLLRHSARLGAELGLGRRLPRRSADPTAQLLRLGALAQALFVLLLARGPLRRSAALKRELDSCPLLLPLLGLSLWALALPLELGSRPWASLWTLALLLDACASLPQLWLAAESGGVLEELASHHLAAQCGAQSLALAFWWSIRTTWLRGMAWTGWGILAATAAPLLLLSHYMGYYFRGCGRGLGSGVPLVLAG